MQKIFLGYLRIELVDMTSVSELVLPPVILHIENCFYSSMGYFKSEGTFSC